MRNASSEGDLVIVENLGGRVAETLLLTIVGVTPPPWTGVIDRLQRNGLSQDNRAYYD